MALDVLVRGGLSAIRAGDAAMVIDAMGHVIGPGCIDPHGHARPVRDGAETGRRSGRLLRRGS